MAASALGIFNALSPRDGGSRRLARGLSYGPEARHRLDIYAPNKTPLPAPVIFFIYGGSWGSGDKDEYGFAGRALAALGYVTVIADYRLVPQVEYPGFLEDGALAMQWVVDHIADYGGDPERMALFGHSAGAYNAAMLVLDARYLVSSGLIDRVRCVVGLSGPYDFFPFDGPISLRVFGGVEAGAATQPVNHVSSAAPSMLLGTGLRDRLVYPRNSSALAERLRGAGVAVEQATYPSLAHAGPLLALSRPLRWIAPVLADAGQFLRRYL